MSNTSKDSRPIASCTLREAGVPYPRTCSVCGLGPCRYEKSGAYVPPTLGDDEIYWRGIFEAFDRLTPGEPDWYHAVSHAIRELMREKIDSLQEGKSP